MKKAAGDPQKYRELAENIQQPPTVSTVAEQYIRLFEDRSRFADDPAA